MPEGFVEVKDLKDIEARVVIKEVLGLSKQKQNLRQLCRVVPLREMQGDIPVVTELAGKSGVRELEEAEITKESYSYIHVDLLDEGKDVVHVAISWEALQRSTILPDIMKMHVQNAAVALAKLENRKIANALTGITAITGSDWSNDSNDPSDDILAAVAEIHNEAKGWDPTYLVMSPAVYAALISNDSVHEQVERGWITTADMPKYCGLKILVDPDVPAKQAFVISPDAPTLMLFEGPTLTNKYDNPTKLYTGYLIARYEAVRCVLPNASRRITGVLP